LKSSSLCMGFTITVVSSHLLSVSVVNEDCICICKDDNSTSSLASIFPASPFCTLSLFSLFS
jgi:hypothetical protein